MNGASITLLPVVRFRHQGQSYAIEAGAVTKQGQLDGQDVELLGHFADCFSTPLVNAEGARQWLELQDYSGQTWRLGLSTAADLIELPVQCVYPLPAILAALRELPALQALALFQNELIALLDATVLQKMLERKPVECRETR